MDALLLLETDDLRNDIGEGGIFVRAELAFSFSFRGLMHRSIVGWEVWNWCGIVEEEGVETRIKGIVFVSYNKLRGRDRIVSNDNKR